MEESFFKVFLSAACICEEVSAWCTWETEEVRTSAQNDRAAHIYSSTFHLLKQIKKKKTEKRQLCNGFHTLTCRENERAQVVQPVFFPHRIFLKSLTESFERIPFLDLGGKNARTRMNPVKGGPLSLHKWTRWSFCLFAASKRLKSQVLNKKSIQKTI